MVLAVVVALAMIAVGTGLLVLGSDWLLDGIGDLARMLGVSAVVLGAVLAGLEPDEMLTAAIASGRGAPNLALGDVLGTNITIVTVALGLSALICPIVIARATRTQAVLATVVSVFPVAVLLVGYVNRVVGVFLLLAFAVYTLLLFRVDPAAANAREALEALEDDDDDDDDDENEKHPARWQWKPVLMTLGALVAIAVGGPALVDGALRLADVAGVGSGVIGLTIVSLGTGGEMIALGITAARKGKSEILVGGIIGSFAYNLLVTLGLAAVVRPLPVDPALLRAALPWMVGAHLLLLGLVFHGRISRWMGGLLVLAYAAYIVVAVIAG